MNNSNSAPFPDLPAIPSFHQALLQAVIETPKGSRNKYTYDHERRVMVLRKVLPAGMVFPYDFGFIPSTLAGDDGPIDVLVLMDEPAFPGCVLDVRVIGVIEGENLLQDGTTYRNDRLLAVAVLSQTYQAVESMEDFPDSLVHQIEEFFVGYPRLLGGKAYRIISRSGPKHAGDLIEQARQKLCWNAALYSGDAC